MRRTTAAVGLFVGFGLLGCDSATSPETPASENPPTMGVLSVEEALTRNSEMGIERAEFRDGFCSLFLFDSSTLYTGASDAVTTNSGNVNYVCKADILFGPGPDRMLEFKDVAFFDFSFSDPPWIIAPCHIRVTPGASGQMRANCHVTPRQGQIIPL